VTDATPELSEAELCLLVFIIGQESVTDVTNLCKRITDLNSETVDSLGIKCSKLGKSKAGTKLELVSRIYYNKFKGKKM
jgi:hypothetical protein